MFTHLHAHSSFSFLDGVMDVEALVEGACRRRMGAIALTDTNGLYGALPFWKKARALGVRPIIGAEMDDPGADERRESARAAGADDRQSRIGPRQGDPDDSADGSGGGGEGGSASGAPTLRPLNHDRRAVVLARNRRGYGALSALITRRRLEPHGFDLSAELDRLSEDGPDDVFILTDSAALLATLGARPGVYGELILTPGRRGGNRRLYDQARDLAIPLVATTAARFDGPGDYPLHRVARAMASLRTVDTLAPGWAAEPENHLASDAEMEAAVRGLKSAIRATEVIAEGCELAFSLRDWQFPQAHLPPGETAYSLLAQQAFEGVRRRYRPLTPQVTARLEYELKVIDQMGFCEYFLAVREIVAEAERRGSPVLGRGSAANSVVSYALGFTPVDPIGMNLCFERFLNPARSSPPDIDLDFSWRERDDVVAWVFERFGWDRVALISTTIRLRARQAIREVGKALGLADGEVSAFTRRIPGWISRSLSIADTLRAFPECADLPVSEAPWDTTLPLAERFLDAPRHLSIHCGGVVIAPRPITDFTPLQRSAKGTIITQMDMGPIEDLGLVKIDLLSNRSLGVYKDCLSAIQGGGAGSGGGGGGGGEGEGEGDFVSHAETRRRGRAAV